jgi:hypothetical protein
MKKILASIVLFLLLLSPSVLATNDFAGIGQGFGEFFGSSADGGFAIFSLVIIVGMVVGAGYYGSKVSDMVANYSSLIAGFAGVIGTTAIGWLPIWIGVPAIILMFMLALYFFKGGE